MYDHLFFNQDRKRKEEQRKFSESNSVSSQNVSNEQHKQEQPSSSDKPFAGKTMQMKSFIDNSPKVTEEKEKISRLFGGSKNNNSIQKKEDRPESGQKIPGEVKSKMEHSFGTDFSDVSIHKDSESASGLHARAFTTGNEVHFAPGEYEPATKQGQELLGHELAHVVQQRQGKVNEAASSGDMTINDSPTLESEADVSGTKAARGEKALPVSSAQASIQKMEDSKPELSEEDKKKFTYGKVSGNLYVDNADKVVEDKKGGGGVDLDDVKQGALGDCYFLSAIGAIARSNPASLKQLIKDNGDGTFDVTLHVYEHFWSFSRSPHVEKVTLDLPLDKDGNPAYSKFGDKNELWVMLLEKAFAQYNGGYSEIEGGNPGEAMEMLSGGSSETFTTSSLSEDQILEKLKTALDGNKAVTASSEKFDDNKKKKQASKSAGVVGGHAYVVKSVNKEAKTISLYNPWGFSHMDGLSIADFKKYYYRFQILN